MSHSLLLLTSNGVGMGHLARQSAVALAAGADTRVTIMSMSAALPAIAELGLSGEYCPGPDRRWQSDMRWPHYVSARIQALAREVSADVVSFDGVAPYRGVTLARKQLQDIPFVWFRRGMWRPGANEGQLWKTELFDKVIEPGDISKEADRGATAGRGDAVEVPPVSLYEVIDRLPREDARTELGLAQDVHTVLVTLGAGRLGEVSSPGKTIVATLLERTDWQIAVLTSAIAEVEIPTSSADRVVEIRGVFPLVRFLEAFDSVVSAAGYNAVHEFLPAGLPTLLIPNLATRTDDQEARSLEAERQGLAIVGREPLNESIDQLIALSRQSQSSARKVTLGGASATADALRAFADTYEPSAKTWPQRVARARDDAKAGAKRVLGPSGTNFVKRMLGRPIEPIGELLRVTQSEGDSDLPVLRFEEEPTVDLLLGPDPVEHVMPASSVSYRSQRDLIAAEHYDIVTNDGS